MTGQLNSRGVRTSSFSSVHAVDRSHFRIRRLRAKMILRLNVGFVIPINLAMAPVHRQQYIRTLGCHRRQCCQISFAIHVAKHFTMPVYQNGCNLFHRREGRSICCSARARTAAHPCQFQQRLLLLRRHWVYHWNPSFKEIVCIVTKHRDVHVRT